MNKPLFWFMSEDNGLCAGHIELEFDDAVLIEMKSIDGQPVIGNIAWLVTKPKECTNHPLTIS